MSFLHEVPESEAAGVLRELYDLDLKDSGYVEAATRVFSNRPDVLAALRASIRQLRTHLRLRRYELVTVAAARAIGCKF